MLQEGLYGVPGGAPPKKWVSSRNLDVKKAVGLEMDGLRAGVIARRKRIRTLLPSVCEHHGRIQDQDHAAALGDVGDSP